MPEKKVDGADSFFQRTRVWSEVLPLRGKVGGDQCVSFVLVIRLTELAGNPTGIHKQE